MKEFFRQLFCRHQYEWWFNGCSTETRLWVKKFGKITARQSYWMCRKCRKGQLRKYAYHG